MCDADIQRAMLQCLQAIADASGDQYEFTDPFTIGGTTGKYQISSPYNTECEWGLVAAVATGSMASTATYAIGSRNPGQPTLSTSGADLFGLITATGRDNNNALESYVGALTAQAPMITFDTLFVPLPSPATIFLTTSTPASSEVLVTLMFRRKLLRIIPDKPRQRPHTHTPSPRRQLRQNAAQSKQVAGFEAQYPQSDTPYQHVAIPTPGQDTGVAKRGIFPLASRKPVMGRANKNASR